MVRRRADQPHPRGRVADLGDPRPDLLAGQLATLTGLGALGHLDLDVVGVGQVLRGHAEAAGRDLLDRRAAQVAVGVGREAVGVLATLTGVGLGAQPVHGDGERLVRLGGDGPVAHGAGGEPLDDLGDGLDLVERDGLAVGELEQPAQRHQPFGLVVHPGGVLLEDLVATFLGRVLQLEHRLGVEQVLLALAAPLVLATDPQVTVRGLLGPRQVREAVAARDLLGDLVEVDAAELGGGAGEVAVDQVLRQPDGLEDLRAGVGRDRRDAHLGHDLEHALGAGVDVVALRLVVGDVLEHVLVDEVGEGLERDVGVDGGGAVPDQQRHVVHLAGVTGLHDQPDLGAGLLAHQVVVHRAGEQQRGDRRQVLVGVAVGQHDDVGAGLDGLRDPGADVVERLADARPALGHRVQPVDGEGVEPVGPAVLVDVEDLGQVVVGQDRLGQHDLAAVLRTGLQEVGLRAEGGRHGRHQLLADGVQRRVGDLREQLREVVEQQPRAVGQHRDGRVGPHRADRLRAGAGHRAEDDLDLLGGVAEGALTLDDRGVLRGQQRARRQVVEVDQAVVQPVAVRLRGSQLALDLLVGHDATGLGVDQEHAPGLQAPLGDHGGLVDVEHADLGGHHDQAVVGDPVARGTQPVAVEDRTDDGAVGEGDGGRAVPRLHHRGVVGVERPAVVGHRLVVLPRLGDHHQHGVRQAAATEVEQLEALVEAGGVGGARRHDRQGVGQPVAEQRRGHAALAGPHPVAVAHHGVDLAVVGHDAVGVRQRPRGEGVGREPRVDQRDGRRQPVVGEVAVEPLELQAGQHPLVDQGASRQRREVGGVVAELADLVLDALAHHEGATLEVHAGQRRVAVPRGDDQLAEGGLDVTGHRAQLGTVVGDVAPADDAQVLVGDDPLDVGGGLLGLARVGGQEADAGGVGPGGRQVEVADLGEEVVVDLQQDAGAVPDVVLGAGGAAVVEVRQRREPLGHDVVAAPSVHVDHEGHPARIVLERRVVQTLTGGGVRSGRRGSDHGGALRGRQRSRTDGSAAASSGRPVPDLRGTHDRGPGTRMQLPRVDHAARPRRGGPA